MRFLYKKRRNAKISIKVSVHSLSAEKNSSKRCLKTISRFPTQRKKWESATPRPGSSSTSTPPPASWTPSPSSTASGSPSRRPRKTPRVSLVPPLPRRSCRVRKWSSPRVRRGCRILCWWGTSLTMGALFGTCGARTAPGRPSDCSQLLIIEIIAS